MFCSRCGTKIEPSVRFCPSCGLDVTQLTGAGQGGATVPMAAAPQQESETELIKDALKDEYELEKELGRGGMAVVYKARDKQLEREVAIKVLPFSLSFDAEFVERFQREARTAGKLEHPNIIPIYRVGKAGRVIYFVMKFIRGKSLSGVIESRGAMPIPELKRMLLECTRALGYAHKHGIVHRDIKPDNIMFDELGQAIVTDFGIAKAQSGAKLTGTGMSIGTPHYMSPEQARAQNLDGRSDIYSLGVVAYQCLTGHVPFDGEDSFSIGYKHIMEELPVPALESAEQRNMFAIVQKMMAKKPDERYQNAEELIAALEGAPAAPAIADIHTEKTVAIEPPKVRKPAPPPIAGAATTPLPRASASMGKPKEAAPPPPAAPPPAPPAKPAFKPKEPEKKGGSKAPIAIAAALVLVGGGLGGYVLMNKNKAAQRQAFVQDSIRRADSARIEVARLDSVRRETARADSIRRADSIAAADRTKRPDRRPPPAPPPAPPAAPTVNCNLAGSNCGTISLAGTIPPNSTVRVDGRTQRGTRIKVPAGSHTIEITAQGFQTFQNRVTVNQNQTVTVQVVMPQTTAAAPPPPAPPTSPAAPAANCSSPTVAIANRNRACWDVRPVPRTTPQVPRPASCPGTQQLRVGILVQVSATGEVLGQPTPTRPRSGCQAFDDLAAAQALDMTFTPATKGGQPVATWHTQLITSVRQ